MKISYNINISKNRVISDKCDDAPDLYKKAFNFHQNGDLLNAKILYEKCLLLNPNHEDALHLLGVVFNQLGKPEVACEYIAKAIKLKSNVAVYHSNLGGAFLAMGKMSEALNSYDIAIALDKKFVDAYFNRGVVLFEMNRYVDAIDSYSEVKKIKSNHMLACFNTGKALEKLSLHAEALIEYQEVVKDSPRLIEAHISIGGLYRKLNKFESALRSFELASDIDPSHALVCVDMAHVHFELKNYEQAFICYKRAIQLKPDCAEAFHGCGMVLTKIKKYDEALLSYQTAMSIDSSVKGLLGAWLMAKMTVSDWSDYDENRNRLTKFVSETGCSIESFLTLAMLDVPAVQKRAAYNYAEEKKLCDFQFNTNKLLINAPLRKKIKIGYYSSDFREHPVAYLMVGVLEKHSSEFFEIIVFSLFSGNGGKMQERVSAGVSKFIDVSNMSSAEIVNLSRDMNVDIAVDLMGYTENCRHEIFLNRCAPIQINYLGYPGTLGHDRMDYIIADHTIVPIEGREYYSEKIVYMPNSHFVYADPLDISEVDVSRSELGLPEFGFVFCCFNNSYKLQPPVFDSWMRILKAVPGSVLMLAEGNATVSVNLRREAEARGVEEKRLVFVGRSDRRTYLARYKLADLFLDTAPYNAGTTAADALWAGLPVLTCIGQSFASRMAAGLVKTAGLSELITKTPAEYEALAIVLGNDPRRIAAIKTRLLQSHSSSPLFDIPLFTKHLEQAYSSMYLRYRSGLEADHIYVSAE